MCIYYCKNKISLRINYFIFATHFKGIQSQVKDHLRFVESYMEREIKSIFQGLNSKRMFEIERHHGSNLIRKTNTFHIRLSHVPLSDNTTATRQRQKCGRAQILMKTHCSIHTYHYLWVLWQLPTFGLYRRSTNVYLKK